MLMTHVNNSVVLTTVTYGSEQKKLMQLQHNYELEVVTSVYLIV